jgi:aspartate 4-decarboxylase
MPTSTHRTDTSLAKLSPFELKDQLIKLAKAAAGKHGSSVQFLNAGRGNPNWTATTPREAFFLLGQFALTEAKRDWDEPGFGGMPQRDGSAFRLRDFLSRQHTLHRQARGSYPRRLSMALRN